PAFPLSFPTRRSSDLGVSSGVCHAFRRGLAIASALVSDIECPVFRLENAAQSISRDTAFLGLLRLIDGLFSERLRPLNRTYFMRSEEHTSELPSRENL